MVEVSQPSPNFSPLDKVIVVGKPSPAPSEGGILGEHGIVIWRSSYFAKRSRWGILGWLYVVHFPQSDTYDGVEESRLVPTDEVVPLASCLGRDFEISYDFPGEGPDAIEGTFRIPGGFWNTFAFRSEMGGELSYTIKIPARFYSGGIAKYDFAVPHGVLLDCLYVEEVMSKVFDAKQWGRIGGPHSGWLK
jgi:hypothetical protein